jgi:hypothetical protein
VQPAHSEAIEVIAGLVERVTYHNADNGFCVLRVQVRGQRDLVTVVGHAATISPGEFIQVGGSWPNDRTHGLQFKAAYLRATAPTTVEGIEKYLGSGMIRGIGPVYAGKLVRAFGEAVFDIIEREPDRLREVTGIGPVRAKRIIAGWAEQRVIREIMLFLHSHSVGTSRAVLPWHRRRCASPGFAPECSGESFRRRCRAASVGGGRVRLEPSPSTAPCWTLYRRQTLRRSRLVRREEVGFQPALAPT